MTPTLSTNPDAPPRYVQELTRQLKAVDAERQSEEDRTRTREVQAVIMAEQVGIFTPAGAATLRWGCSRRTLGPQTMSGSTAMGQRSCSRQPKP